MENSESIEAVESARFLEEFRRPLYESYCFSRIPHTLLRLLGEASGSGKELPGSVFGGNYPCADRVGVIFVDAMGWHLLARHWDTLPMLQRIRRDGVISRLTAQFPSTTAAHVTSLWTGLEPGAHGILEWFYFEPKLRRIVSPLMFSELGNRERNSLLRLGTSPSEILPPPLMGQALKKAGIESCLIQPADYSTSAYTRHMTQGVTAIGVKSLDAASREFVQFLSGEGRRLAVLYWDKVDVAAHDHGPEAEQVHRGIQRVMRAVEEKMLPALRQLGGKTHLIFFADHGQEAVSPERVVYLDEAWPELLEMLPRTANGLPAAPIGSSRDLFVPVPRERVAEVVERLRLILTDRARVLPTRELLAAGSFGPSADGETVLARLGEVAILPRSGQMVFWSLQGTFRQNFFGHHGGLTPAEMDIPFLWLEV